MAEVWGWPRMHIFHISSNLCYRHQFKSFHSINGQISGFGWHHLYHIVPVCVNVSTFLSYLFLATLVYFPNRVTMAGLSVNIRSMLSNFWWERQIRKLILADNQGVRISTTHCLPTNKWQQHRTCPPFNRCHCSLFMFLMILFWADKVQIKIMIYQGNK